MGTLKRICAIALLCALIGMHAPQAFAEGLSVYMHDETQLLLPEETEALRHELQSLQVYGIHVGLVIKGAEETEDTVEFVEGLMAESGQEVSEPRVWLVLDMADMYASIHWDYADAEGYPTFDDWAAISERLTSVLWDSGANETAHAFIEEVNALFTPNEVDPTQEAASRALSMRALVPEGRQAERFIYDEANLLTEAEIEELEAFAQGLYAEYATNFILVTCQDEGNTEENLKYYSEEYHNQKLGLGGSDSSVMLTIDMGIRNYRVDFFGVSKDIVGTDDRTVPVTAGIRDDMRAGEYASAYRMFCALSQEVFDEYLAAQVESEQLEQMLRTVDYPAKRVYIEEGLLSAEEQEQLEGMAKACADSLQADFAVVLAHGLLGQSGGISYSFTQALEAAAAYEDGVMLLLDAGYGEISLSRRGAAQPVRDTDEERNLASQIESDVQNRDYIAALTAFFGTLEQTIHQTRLVQNMEVPMVDRAVAVHDFAGALSAEERTALETLAASYRERDKVDYMFVICDLEEDWMGQEYLKQFRIENPNLETTVLLVIDANTRSCFADYWGSKPYRKIRWDDWYDATAAAEIEVSGGNVYAACEAFLAPVAKNMHAIFTAAMLEDAPLYVSRSVVYGFIVMALGMLVLIIINISAKGRREPASNYMKQGSFYLDYSKDIFLHTHTSATRRAEPSKSGGGGGGISSGGSSSSRGSQSSF